MIGTGLKYRLRDEESHIITLHIFRLLYIILYRHRHLELSESAKKKRK
jgi:hypothetical protein